MIPNYRFQHIRIEDYWPKSHESLCQYAMQVTPPGRGGLCSRFAPPRVEKCTPQEVAASLAPQGCLQVALLHTAPLKACNLDEVYDVHLVSPCKPFRVGREPRG